MNDSPDPPLRPMPRKLISGAMLLFTVEGHLLIVRGPDHTEWGIPGGLAEFGESPWQAARREVREELGLERDPGPLLSVEWRPPMSDVGDGVHFIFEGGVVSAAEIAGFQFQPSEVAAARFLPPEEACASLPDRLAARVRPALAVRPNGPPVYLEAGHVRGGAAAHPEWLAGSDQRA